MGQLLIDGRYEGVQICEAALTKGLENLLIGTGNGPEPDGALDGVVPHRPDERAPVPFDRSLLQVQKAHDAGPDRRLCEPRDLLWWTVDHESHLDPRKFTRTGVSMSRLGRSQLSAMVRRRRTAVS